MTALGVGQMVMSGALIGDIARGIERLVDDICGECVVCCDKRDLEIR